MVARKIEVGVYLYPPRYDWETAGTLKSGEFVTVNSECWFHPYDGGPPVRLNIRRGNR